MAPAVSKTKSLRAPRGEPGSQPLNSGSGQPSLLVLYLAHAPAARTRPCRLQRERHRAPSRCEAFRELALDYPSLPTVLTAAGSGLGPSTFVVLAALSTWNDATAGGRGRAPAEARDRGRLRSGIIVRRLVLRGRHRPPVPRPGPAWAAAVPRARRGRLGPRQPHLLPQHGRGQPRPPFPCPSSRHAARPLQCRASPPATPMLR